MAGVIDMIRRHGVLAWTLAVNCVIFFLMALCAVSGKLGAPLLGDLPLWLELPAHWSLWLQKPWTLVTYMFTHQDFFHLLFNMLWLLWFGYILLERYSPGRLMGLYFGGGIAGGLLYMVGPYLIPSLYPWGSHLLGASASVMAIMAAAAVLMPDYRLHLFFIGDVKLRWMALGMIVLAFLGLGGGNAGGSVAHIGGVLYGVVAGLAFRGKSQEVRGKSLGNVRVTGREPKRRDPFKKAGTVGNPRLQAEMDEKRLDQLLDKIRVSGFNSLSNKEREELETLSRRLQK